MGQAPANVSAKAALDRFFASYYAARPVAATFTGVHDFDHALPDWSPDGLRLAVDEMRSLRRDLDAAGRVGDDASKRFPDEVDLALADGFLDIQIAEHEGPHFYRCNPALWTGEAIFGVLSLVTRPVAPIDERLQSAASRLCAIERFLADARRTLEAAPSEWKARALRECGAADILFGRSLPAWLHGSGASSKTIADAAEALATARKAFGGFAAWLEDELLVDDHRYAAGRELLGLLLARGHWCRVPISELMIDATRALNEGHDTLAQRIRDVGAADWATVERLIAANHPTVEDYLPRFTRMWERFRRVADEHALVSWPDAPIHYVFIPRHMREAAPLLYYLSYRSPAPFDPSGLYDYLVAPVGDGPPDETERRLAAANDCAIALNHVVHHGGLGHHVQNQFAYRSRSRIGQVAAVDAASRIAMFSGGSLAEGWACYACDLMEEVGALTPLERASLQHTRVRLAARAVVDLALHTGQMTMADAAVFFSTRGLMPGATAHAEAVKVSMFPGTAIMYWLGTNAIHDLRVRPSRLAHARPGLACTRSGQAGGPTLRAFHDRLLSYGALPVPLIARLMAEGHQ
jgi:hypothetical protein